MEQQLTAKQRLIRSGLSILVAVVAIGGATYSFFSDTETSTGNTFTAGSLDLKVDSEAHYNGLICRDAPGDPVAFTWLEPLIPVPTPTELAAFQALEHYNDPCDGTWAATDLGVTNQFFQLTDVKPGDDGENTISLHVLDNDAWGRFVISEVTDLDGTCTEPESEVTTAEPECPTPDNTPATTPGELAESITFFAWLDQGATPGFQCNNPAVPATAGARCTADSTEGDNIQQCATPDNPQEDCAEPLVILPGTVNENLSPDQSLADETHNIWQALALIDTTYCPPTAPANGHNNYGPCHGVADDGRMVGSVTYYFGLGWSVPTSVGNEAQTDSLNANLTFEVEQQRNNPVPFDGI